MRKKSAKVKPEAEADRILTCTEVQVPRYERVFQKWGVPLKWQFEFENYDWPIDQGVPNVQQSHTPGTSHCYEVHRVYSFMGDNSNWSLSLTYPSCGGLSAIPRCRDRVWYRPSRIIQSGCKSLTGLRKEVSAKKTCKTSLVTRIQNCVAHQSRTSLLEINPWKDWKAKVSKTMMFQLAPIITRGVFFDPAIVHIYSNRYERLQFSYPSAVYPPTMTFRVRNRQEW